MQLRCSSPGGVPCLLLTMSAQGQATPKCWTASWLDRTQGGHDSGQGWRARGVRPAPINSQLRLVSVGPGVGHAEHPAARVREGPELALKGFPSTTPRLEERPEQQDDRDPSPTPRAA